MSLPVAMDQKRRIQNVICETKLSLPTPLYVVLLKLKAFIRIYENTLRKAVGKNPCLFCV